MLEFEPRRAWTLLPESCNRKLPNSRLPASDSQEHLTESSSLEEQLPRIRVLASTLAASRFQQSRWANQI